jgi:hypothetical protein
MTKNIKLYEISNDPILDKHILVPVGYVGLNEKELQSMEDQVRKADKLRIQDVEEIRKIKREEHARLKALEKENPAYKERWEKLNKRKLGEIKPRTPEQVNRENQRQPVGGKAGCASCAKKGLMGILKGGAKLLKAELGIDAADEATKAKRKALCLSCSNYDFGICREADDDGKDIGGCGCVVAYKVLLAGEECPRKKW